MSYQYRSAFPFFLRCRSAPTMRTWAHIFSILKVMGGGILSLATKCRRGKQSDKMTASVGFHKRNKGDALFPRASPLKKRSPGAFINSPLAEGYLGQGNFALCGSRPEALPLDSAAFEKAGETL